MNSLWLKYLPVGLRTKIEHRPNLQKALTNIGWLFGDRMLRMGVGLLIVIWLARYLGSEQFGQLNYAIAFVSLFGAVAALGLNGIVVRDILREPESVYTTLGTAFVLQLIGGLIAVALIVGTITILRPEDQLIKIMVAILGLSLVFKSSEVIKYWFESQVQSRYTVWVENSVFLLITTAKAVLILSEAPLIAFVWIVLVEAILVTVGLFGIYIKREGRIWAWSVQGQRAKTLLRDSWPLVLAGLAFMVYMRIDQIMIGQMLGDDAVGIYSAAVRLSEVWYFIATAILASVFPSIINAKNQSDALYRTRLQKLYDVLVLLALCVAIPVTFLSDQFISFLFGADYVLAGPILAVHVWSGVFIFLGYASNKRLVVEGLQKAVLFRTLLGAFTNIVANWLLIPLYGIVGAALASLLSYFVALFSVCFSTATRSDVLLILKSLSLQLVYSRWMKVVR